MPVYMNAWLCEKALSLVVASGFLLRAAELVDPEALCPWGETVGEFIRGEAWLVYHRACGFMAYATGGFPDDPDEKVQAGILRRPRGHGGVRQGACLQEMRGVGPAQP